MKDFGSLVPSAFALALTLLLGSCGAPSKAVKKKPNILFLFADDQRADTIGAWGNSRIQTPNIDRLVEQGVSFRSNYNMGANQGAVCVASRAMLNASQPYFRIPMDLKGVTTMPEWLGKHGYTTFATGKWHNRRPSWLRSFQYGKTIMFGGMSDHTKVPVEDLLPDGTLGNQRTDGFSSVIFANAFIDFLKNYKDDKPFYAYVAFTSPHDPRQPPMKYREMYYEKRPLLPRNFLPQHPFNLGPKMTGRDEQLAAWPRTKNVISDQLAEYYGMITYLDEQIGRVLQALDESGKASNTYIIYSADHGLAMGSHGLLGKQNIYECSQKCPLIFLGPGIPKRTTTEAFTYLMDVFPTVTSLAGIETPPGLAGKDLSPILHGEKEKVRDHIFLGFMNWMRSVRGEQYKLIRYPQIDYTQLFDLKADPDEMKNLAAEPAQAERVKSMMALLKKMQGEVGDTQPLKVAKKQPFKVNLTGHKRKPDKWQPEWIIKKYF